MVDMSQLYYIMIVPIMTTTTTTTTQTTLTFDGSVNLECPHLDLEDNLICFLLKS